MKSLLSILFIFCIHSGFGQENIDYNSISEALLENVKQNKPVENAIAILEKSTLKSLNTSLTSDAKKIAFWVNIYNAFIQISLKEKPELYEDRGSFFGDKRIKIAGEELSFDEIEHGILRESKIKISLGYLKKLFPANWEKKLRVENVDWRIHFALNCGAKSCPPVAVYNPKNLDKQLNYMTKQFLSKHTTFRVKDKTAKVTSLFSWFRGDFGGISEVKKILKKYNATPVEPNSLEFTEYNWELFLDNYTTIPN